MKLESNFKNMVLSLTAISLVAAGLLGAAYTLTEAPIAASKAAKQANAIKQVLPAFDRTEEAEVDGQKMFKAYKDDQFVGAAVEAIDEQGFGGKIKLMVGFDQAGNIVDYAVLEQAETPGLGAKMVNWFKKGAKGDITGKNPATANLTVSKDKGEIDAITAATISSRAFLRAVAAAYQAYAAQNGTDALNADALTAATQPAPNDSINPQTQENNEQ